MASAAEEEEAELGDQTHGLEGRDEFEKNVIYKPELAVVRIWCAHVDSLLKLSEKQLVSGENLCYGENLENDEIEIEITEVNHQSEVPNQVKDVKK
ncbi:hypothetical protein SASPL_132781 [Salvia splendens]|uniref:Uncharacterized protein n=1 Tax=Salvia splendens TaxID=180675 RepID=A0A8X8X037_SALSN|nr:hypothetical protein SASPL_132781 [Salvia splendens]